MEVLVRLSLQTGAIVLHRQGRTPGTAVGESRDQSECIDGACYVSSKTNEHLDGGRRSR